MINHPTHHFSGYSTQWRFSCSCPSSQKGQGIYNYIYFWGFSGANPWSTCLASHRDQTYEMHMCCIYGKMPIQVQNVEVCPARPCVDIYHIQLCIWIYVCKGHDWTHICLTYVHGWTFPHLLIQRSVTSVIPLPDTVRVVFTLRNWYHDGNFTFNIRSIFQGRSVWRTTWKRGHMLYFIILLYIFLKIRGDGKKYQYIVVFITQYIFLFLFICWVISYIYDMVMMPFHSCNNSYCYYMYLLYFYYSGPCLATGVRKRG